MSTRAINAAEILLIRVNINRVVLIQCVQISNLIYKYPLSLTNNFNLQVSTETFCRV